MFGVDKYYPVQGTNKFQTVSFPITKAFHVDLKSSTGATTYALFTVPKGAMVLGFVAKVTEAMEATAAATLQLGFTGTDMLSTAHASATAVLGTIIAPPNTSLFKPYVLSADDSFDVIIGTAKISAGGEFDCFLTYIPIPQDPLSTVNFLSYTPGA